MFYTPAVRNDSCAERDHVCGGLKAQLLRLAQGNALGGIAALIKVSRSVRAAYFMRGNAPWHCKWGYALGARGIFAVQKCRMY